MDNYKPFSTHIERENRMMTKDKNGFLYIGSVAFAGFVMMMEYYTTSVCFISNYWMYSILLMIVLFLVVFLLFKNIPQMSILFFVPFLYTMPVVSFYTIPKVIHTLNIIDSKDIGFKAVVERVAYTYRADPPYLYAKVHDLPLMTKMKVQVEDRDYNILHKGDDIIVYGTISMLCFRYVGYEKYTSINENK